MSFFMFILFIYPHLYILVVLSQKETKSLTRTLTPTILTLLHSKRPKLHGVLAVLSAIGFKQKPLCPHPLTFGGQNAGKSIR